MATKYCASTHGNAGSTPARHTAPKDHVFKATALRNRYRYVARLQPPRRCLGAARTNRRLFHH